MLFKVKIQFAFAMSVFIASVSRTSGKRTLSTFDIEYSLFGGASQNFNTTIIADWYRGVKTAIENHAAVKRDFDEMIQDLSRIRRIIGSLSGLKDHNEINHIYHDSFLSTSRIIQKFDNSDFHFQQFPIVAVPIMMAFVPIVAFITKGLPNYQFAVDSCCQFANTLAEYFQPYLMERIKLMDVDMYYFNYSGEGFTHKDVFASEMNSKFGGFKVNVSAVPEIDKFKSDNCFELHKSLTDYNKSKNTENLRITKTIVIRDNFDENGRFYKTEGELCLKRYLLLFRNRLEEEFIKAIKTLTIACQHEPKKIPTGSGWLNLYISGVFINYERYTSGKNDPYVGIYVNDQSVYNTTQLDNRSDWVRFDQTFYSELIDKNSNITIKLFDVQSHFDGRFEDTILLEETWNVASILKSSKIASENHTLIFSASWRDKMSQKEMEVKKVNEKQIRLRY